MNWLKCMIIAVLLPLVFPCPGAAQGPAELTVSAAASLTNAFQELGKQYEQ